jgi:hypothetical protein
MIGTECALGLHLPEEVPDPGGRGPCDRARDPSVQSVTAMFHRLIERHHYTLINVATT